MTSHSALVAYGDDNDLNFLDTARSLFREYESYLNVDLCFQDYEAEISALPGKYSSPRGALFLAYSDQSAVGCVAVRPLDESTCEMKRLYVRESSRGCGLGRQLAQRAMSFASDAQYRRMVLDTLDRLTAAVALYTSLGFTEIPPYYGNPLEGVVYLGKEL